MAHRFYIPPENWDAAALALEGGEARHCSQVMRLRAGDQITVFNGTGDEATARITAVEKSRVTLETVSARRVEPPPFRITLAPALVKAGAWEWLLEKAVELGADEIQPIITEHCVVRVTTSAADRKAEKWRHLLIESCKQCGRAWLPRLRDPAPLASLLDRVADFDAALIGEPCADSVSIRAACAASAARLGRAPISALLLIGPEGGFAGEEISAAVAAGCTPVKLGAHTLRAETATLAGMALLAQELEPR